MKMFHGFNAILYKEFIVVLRDPMTLFFMFFPPLIEMIAFGYALDNDVKHMAMVVFNEDRTVETRQLIDEAAAFDGAVLVEHDGGHVFHVVVERVAEGDHLDERREEHEEERERIAQHHDEFLVENGAVTAEGGFHRAAPFVRSFVSATNTSSSEGPMG